MAATAIAMPVLALLFGHPPLSSLRVERRPITVYLLAQKPLVCTACNWLNLRASRSRTRLAHKQLFIDLHKNLTFELGSTGLPSTYFIPQERRLYHGSSLSASSAQHRKRFSKGLSTTRNRKVSDGLLAHT